MTSTLRNMPRYIRNTDAFGWQGADNPDGPWRSITPPQNGTPWQTTSAMDDLRQVSAEVSGVEVWSPAAQVVMDAFRLASDGCYINGEWVQDHAGQVAAALCAAAYQVAPPRPSLDSCCEHWEQGIRHKLLAIAAELEGAKPDPLEPNDLSHLSDEEFQALAPQGYHAP